jgi:hypothetical protein
MPGLHQPCSPVAFRLTLPSRCHACIHMRCAGVVYTYGMQTAVRTLTMQARCDVWELGRCLRQCTRARAPPPRALATRPARPSGRHRRTCLWLRPSRVARHCSPPLRSPPKTSLQKYLNPQIVSERERLPYGGRQSCLELPCKPACALPQPGLG